MSAVHNHKVPCAGVKAFVVGSQGRLLILRHAVHERTGQPQWGLPGGHVDWDEDPEDALEREFKEELGVAIAIKSPILAWNKSISQEHQVIYIGYLGVLKNPNDPFRLKADDDQYHWMSPHELDQYFPYSDLEYRPAIERYYDLKS